MEGRMTTGDPGSPYAPHTPEETQEMLTAIGVGSEAELFDIPPAVQFDGSFDIRQRDERTVRNTLDRMQQRNADLISFLGRGHYDHYVPSIVDHLSDRSEFLTSYTQYQPEIAQGFLQALFEYQSMVVELTGLEVANCSLYDGATALAEAALLAGRVRDGDRILVPDIIRDERKDVLRNYVSGSGFLIEEYETTDANVDLDSLSTMLDSDVVMVLLESPNDRGVIEEQLEAATELAHDVSAVSCLWTDPVALGLLSEPASLGIDVVVGDAGVLGLPVSYGMGLGLFSCREKFLRRVPGRLVGASTDSRGNRAFTLTLQTREQHIRRERATSNICTNQAWVALRTAIHLASLGPSGLVELAETCVSAPRELAGGLDPIQGVQAPVHDRHHFREFVASTDQPAQAVADYLLADGFAVGVVGDHELQFCVTETNRHAMDDLISAVQEAA